MNERFRVAARNDSKVSGTMLHAWQQDRGLRSLPWGIEVSNTSRGERGMPVIAAQETKTDALSVNTATVAELEERLARAAAGGGEGERERQKGRGKMPGGGGVGRGV